MGPTLTVREEHSLFEPFSFHLCLGSFVNCESILTWVEVTKRFYTPRFTLTGGLGANDCETVFVFIFVLTTSTVGSQVWERLASIILELQPQLGL